MLARPQKANFSPALAVSLLLHVAVFAAGLIAWREQDKPAVMNGVTSVTIVDASAADVSSAIEAPEPAPAMTETPAPDAPPEMPAPEPAPPAPPPPAPRPTPTPPVKTPPKPVPTPAAKAPAKAPPRPAPSAKAPAKPAQKAAPSKQSSDDFLASLSKSLAPSQKAGGARSGAQQGKNQAQTAAAARQGKGNAEAALADASALVAARLMRAWNPNCSVEGAGAVVVRVRFQLDQRGELQGSPQLLDQGSGPVWQAAADRALRAVAQAAPYSELPKESYNSWKSFTARFRGDQACR